jgi:thioester reductase-like protein
VNWYSHYDALRAANVIATHQLLQITASSPHLNRYVFISTSPQSDPAGSGDETTFRQSLARADGYGQSKLVAEQIVSWAADEDSGLSQCLSIVKPAFIIGSASSGVANVDDFIWRLVAGCVSIGMFPTESSDSFIYISTCDKVATTALQCLWGHGQPLKARILHGLRVSRFWRAVNSVLEKPLKPVSVREWHAKLEICMRDAKSNHPCLPIWHLCGNSEQILGSVERSPYEDEHLRYEAELERSVARNINYLMAFGYFSDARIATSQHVFRRRALRIE